MIITAHTPAKTTPLFEGFDPSPDGLEILVLESITEYELDAQAVFENSQNTMYEKFNAMINTLRAKIKAWFTKMIEMVNELFQVKSRFVKKHKQELLKKPQKGFRYSALPYDLRAGDDYADKCFSEIESSLNDLQHTAGADDAARNAGRLGGSDGDSTILSKFVFSVYHRLGFLSANGSNSREILNALVEKIRLIYRGNEDFPLMIEDFSATPLSEMITRVENYTSTIQSLRKDAARTDKLYSRAIMSVPTKVEKSAREQGIEEKLVRDRQVAINSLLKLSAAVAQVRYQTVNEALNSFYKTIHEFAVYKEDKKKDTTAPTKENLLQSAIDFV